MPVPVLSITKIVYTGAAKLGPGEQIQGPSVSGGHTAALGHQNNAALHKGVVMKMLHSCFTALLLIGFFCSHAFFAQAETPPKPGPAAGASSEKVPSEEAKKRKDWAVSMHKKAAPKKGCFTAAYPSTDWKVVPCGPMRKIPMIPRGGPRPFTAGDGHDISAEAPSGHISQAIGHFENIVNVTSESGPIGNSGPSIANAYTLQINTNFFTGTSVCAASPNPNCQGWEQFVYENYGTGGSAYIQYWIIAYNANCPAGQNWNQLPLYGGIYCWKNNSGGSAPVPNQPITNIGNWFFSGAVSSTSDSVVMTTGTNAYTMPGDNAVNAANGWTTAEFNILGDGSNSTGGSTATFNAGASVTTRTEIFYGGTAAPNCVAQGFTAEKNNFSFGPIAPAATPPGPAAIFYESVAATQVANCAFATTIGDTHLQTFNGLFYDFQASGDFTLAEVEPGFTVQTRQVSGAPTWPDASVNKAVAARFGKTQVAICLAPDQTAKVFVDGKPTAVQDRKTVALPEGAAIRRQGSAYQIVGEDGNSVLATVNSYNNTAWINVNVGLGRWPSPVKGLIANPGGNVNQIATRDNVILTNPFNFDDLYHRFADSWRVTGNASMLSVCNAEKTIEQVAPKQAFFAKNLEAGVQEKARGVCTAAGVKAGALLDACTLDVAVIGQDAAAKVFVDAVAPVAVGTVTTGNANGAVGFLQKWWWLLLALVLVIIVVVWFLKPKKP